MFSDQQHFRPTPIASAPNSTVDFSDDVEFMVDETPTGTEEMMGTNMLTVHNVLASATLSCSTRLDLDKCCLALGNSYYNPAEFPALRIDVKGRSNAVYTLSLFETGRIQSTGGCRPLEAKKAMMKIGRRLNEKLNYGITFQNFEIQNVLAVFDSCTQVNLAEFVGTYNGHVDYEPDRFPAARVRIPVPKKKADGEDYSEDVDEGSDRRATLKLRKLMMGESASESDLTAARGSAPTGKAGVGSYIVGAGSKRAASTRQRDEKQAKEEAVTANVFSTGKITFTGAKSIQSLNYALEKLKPAIGMRSASVGTLLPTPLADLGHQHNPFAMSSSPMMMMIPPSPSSPFPLSYYQQYQQPPPQQQQHQFNPFLQMSMASNSTPPVVDVATRAQQLLMQEHHALEQEQRLRAFRSTPALQQHQHHFTHPLRTT